MDDAKKKEMVIGNGAVTPEDKEQSSSEAGSIINIQASQDATVDMEYVTLYLDERVALAYHITLAMSCTCAKQ